MASTSTMETTYSPLQSNEQPLSSHYPRMCQTFIWLHKNTWHGLCTASGQLWTIKEQLPALNNHRMEFTTTRPCACSICWQVQSLSTEFRLLDSTAPDVFNCKYNAFYLLLMLLACGAYPLGSTKIEVQFSPKWWFCFGENRNCLLVTKTNQSPGPVIGDKIVNLVTELFADSEAEIRDLPGSLIVWRKKLGF